MRTAQPSSEPRLTPGMQRRACAATATPSMPSTATAPNTAGWLTWARTHILRLDPLTEPPTMPEAPEASPDALQAHLPEGWSARGPEYGHR
jgi:hypothetical protein